VSKRLKQNIYIAIITLLALTLFVFSYKLNQEINILDMLFWSALAIIAETFLIISPSSGAATSVGPAIYIYIMLLSKPFSVIMVIIIAGIFRFPEYDGERKHIFNAKRSTTVFNMANLMISFGLCAWIIEIYHGENYLIIVFFIVLGLLAAELINFILVAILIKITQGVQPIQIFRSMVKTFPSTVAIGSLGLLLAIADEAYGNMIVLVFFIPLLLARYSFKLYFESQRMALDTIHALNEALHAKDAYTGGHTGRVEKYAVELAAAYGLSHADCEVIRTAALLHDIGKSKIPLSIVNKPARLTAKEFQEMKKHPELGYKMLLEMGETNQSILDIVRHHHEKLDGSGYLQVLSDENITQEVQIVTICDIFDALTSNRSYKQAASRFVTFKTMKVTMKDELNMTLLNQFIKLMGE